MAKKKRMYVTKSKSSLEMRFPSELANINQAEEETRRFLQNAGLSEDVFPVCLVMREALLNAVTHGNRNNPENTVSYHLRLNDDILTMEVEDEGEGFNWPAMKPDHPAVESEHGRGLFIMQRYFSNLTYNQKGNKLTLTRFCSRRPDKQESDSDRLQSRLDKLTQKILAEPESIRDLAHSDLFSLIEGLYIRFNRLALENAELRLARSWRGSSRKPGASPVESDDRYRALFENNPIETIIVDHDCRVTEYNLAKEKSGGRLPQIGFVMYRDYAAGHKIDMHRELQDAIRLGQPKEFPESPYRSRYLHIRISPFSGGAIITSLDITPLKEAEKNLARLATAIDQTREEIVVVDVDGRIEYANETFLTNHHYSREEALGLVFFNDSRRPCDKAPYEEIWGALRQGRPWTGRFARDTLAGGDPREMEATIAPVKDKIGNVFCYVSVSRDLTRELLLEKQLRYVQRMRAIGTLAGGIAHEFNNSLGAMMMNAELIKKIAGTGSEPADSAEKILAAGRRAGDLINQIQLFSMDYSNRHKPLRIAIVVRETLKMLRAMLPSTIEMSQRIVEKEAMVLGDPTQIQQMLMNLCNNSAAAMQENGGHLKVGLERAALEELAGFPELPAGDYLKLTVHDTGGGLPPDIAERIVDSFLSGGSFGRRSGLGIFVTQGIVTGHGGRMSVAVDEGKWTEIKIFLPVFSSPAVPLSESGETIMPVGSESILLVDDEPLMVEVGEKMLLRLGYQVTTADSGKTALERFMEDPHRYDLVITDMTMPYMTGVDLARTLMEIRPDIPIILCTGFNVMITPEKAAQAGIKKFITKPFEMGRMAAAIRETLAARSS